MLSISLFTCTLAVQIWTRLGIYDRISASLRADRSGSEILEQLICGERGVVPGTQATGFRETIVVGCWYLWWLRRRVTHEGKVYPIGRSAVSILAIQVVLLG